MRELTIDAAVVNTAAVLEFIDAQLEEAGCPIKAQTQIDVAVEEIFVNIAHYAYAPGKGKATVSVEVSKPDSMVTITFKDRGIPYNPAEKIDPDVTLSVEEREVGGLGIFMVKQLMDHMSYEYRDGQNVLHLQKKI
ncbi:MAG: ATP-binding protein [Solobacterium sp.]|nr:ATP-binding protein [Solobacterium sp.]